ncbi:cyclic lactone autoinducer peptide [Ruminococcus sp.]|uniref:cyclic lactone autoinducer peptide n=1 Tax=Ruminococcus sp. TaxID=41978 RepID=UPI0025CC4CE6|nr:cyclic lactone autoinducer peptide [Ruminococcus sp.]
MTNWMKISARFGGMFAALAMLVTAWTVNSTCIYLTHQEELPEHAKKLRKF